MGEVLDLLREGLALNDANDLDGFVALMGADVEWLTPDGPLRGRDAVRDYVGASATRSPTAGTRSTGRSSPATRSRSKAAGRALIPGRSQRRRATCRRPGGRSR